MDCQSTEDGDLLIIDNQAELDYITQRKVNITGTWWIGERHSLSELLDFVSCLYRWCKIRLAKCGWDVEGCLKLHAFEKYYSVQPARIPQLILHVNALVVYNAKSIMISQ